jgi:hypothetical protein
MSRLRRRKPSRAGGLNVVLGVGLIAISVLLAGGLAAAYFLLPRPLQLDQASLCPIDGPRSITVILVDATDDLPAAAKAEVATLLVDIAEGLPEHGLLELRVLDPARLSSRVMFERCNPGDGSTLSEFTGNPRMARQRWLESFRGPVTEAMNNSLSSAESATSPIMAAIQNVSVERFTGRRAEAVHRRLFIVSDMLENGPNYSQYNGDVSFARYKNSTAYRAFSTDLHGADVFIFYVQRAMRRPLDSREHMQFWMQWVSDNKGHLREVTRLQGLS